jgi:hypothetical protein
MEPTLSDLKSITETLLAGESSYLQIRNACTDLLDLFCRITGFDEADRFNNQHMQTAGGQAVSPQSAAICIRDFIRTRVFMRGLREAILARLHENPGKPVHVLYAGTGPFATLLLPLVTIFDATQLKMQLLDINPASLSYLRRLIDHFKLQGYVEQLLETDAVTYRVPAHRQPDIIVSETMMPALKTEPQISIVVNLVGQCPQALLVPQKIEITAALLSSKVADGKRVNCLQGLLTFTKESALVLAQKADEVISFPSLTLQIEKPPAPYWSRLVLLTDIVVFNEEQLSFNQSGLTIPEVVFNLHNIKTWPAVFKFQYCIFPKPGFVISANINAGSVL